MIKEDLIGNKMSISHLPVLDCGLPNSRAGVEVIVITNTSLYGQASKNCREGFAPSTGTSNNISLTCLPGSISKETTDAGDDASPSLQSATFGPSSNNSSNVTENSTREITGPFVEWKVDNISQRRFGCKGMLSHLLSEELCFL